LYEVLEIAREAQEAAAGRARVERIDEPAAKVALELGRAASQVRSEHVSDEVVQHHPVAQRLGAGVLAQPRERPPGVDVRQCGRDQLGRGDVRERGDREHAALLSLGLGIEQALQEPVRDAWRPRVRERVCRHATRLGSQRERER
jgi:hypothetical protein